MFSKLFPLSFSNSNISINMYSPDVELPTTGANQTENNQGAAIAATDITVDTQASSIAPTSTNTILLGKDGEPLNQVSAFIIGAGLENEFNKLKLVSAGNINAVTLKNMSEFAWNLSTYILESKIVQNQNDSYMDSIINLFGSRKITLGSGETNYSVELSCVKNTNDYDNLVPTAQQVKQGLGKVIERKNIIQLEKTAEVFVKNQILMQFFNSESTMISIINLIISQLTRALKVFKFNFILDTVTYVLKSSEVQELVLYSAGGSGDVEVQSWADIYRALQDAIKPLEFFEKEHTIGYDSANPNETVFSNASNKDLVCFAPINFKKIIDISAANVYNPNKILDNLALDASQIYELPATKINNDAGTLVDGGDVIYPQSVASNWTNNGAASTANRDVLLITEKQAFEYITQVDFSGSAEFINPGIAGLTYHKSALVFDLFKYPRKALRIVLPAGWRDLPMVA